MNGLLEKNASESAPIATLPIGTYREIPLTQGKVAIVDPEDYEWINQWKWYTHKNGKTWYALRTAYKNGRSIKIIMHRVILNTPEGMDTDHINGNGLDNRHKNLRACTQSENQHNQRVGCRKKTSVFKGVTLVKRNGLWQAQVKPPDFSHQVYLGQFVSEIDAALAYDKAARKYYGEFACVNFKED